MWLKSYTWNIINMAEHNKLGKSGEQIAVEYLQKKGYKILETNWHAGISKLI